MEIPERQVGNAVGVIGSQETEAMPLSFQNLYTEAAYVALPWIDPDCNPDPRRKSGWYAVPRNRWVEFDKC